MKITTIKDVAEHAGVCASTICSLSTLSDWRMII